MRTTERTEKAQVFQLRQEKAKTASETEPPKKNKTHVGPVLHRATWHGDENAATVKLARKGQGPEYDIKKAAPKAEQSCVVPVCWLALAAASSSASGSGVSKDASPNQQNHIANRRCTTKTPKRRRCHGQDSMNGSSASFLFVTL